MSECYGSCGKAIFHGKGINNLREKPSLVPRLSPRPTKNRKGGGEPGIDSHVIPRHARH